MLDYICTDKFGKNDLLRVQNRLLSMAMNVHQVLERHDIKYFISFGTLLGAVRHKGFIPWDDDFDIFLFEDEYDEALYWLKKELPNWMLVHNEETDEIYWPYWSRIRDLGTEIYLEEVYTDDRYYKYRGLSLDMYKLKKCKRDEFDLSIYKENLSFYERKYKVGLINSDVYREKISLLNELIEKELNREKNISKNDEIYYFIVYIKKLEIEEVFPLKKYQFEDCEFWGPNNADSLLRQAYGDYMQLPPLKKRKPHASYVRFYD